MPRANRSPAPAKADNPTLFPEPAAPRGRDMFSMPDRFRAVTEPERGTVSLTDQETGREVHVAAAAYGEVRRVLGAFFGGNAEGQDNYMPGTIAPAASPGPDADAPAARTDPEERAEETPAAAPARPAPAAKPPAAKPSAKAASSSAAPKPSPAPKAPAAKPGSKAPAAKASAAPPAPAPEPEAPRAAPAPAKKAAAPAKEAAAAKSSPKPPAKAPAKPQGKASGGSAQPSAPSAKAAPAAKAPPPKGAPAPKSAPAAARKEKGPALPEGWERTVRGEGYVMEFEADPQSGAPGYVVQADGKDVARVRQEAPHKLILTWNDGAHDPTPHKNVAGVQSRVDTVLDVDA